MEDTRFVDGFSELYGKSQLHPVGVTLLLCFGFLMLILPRRHAMVMMIACASFIATGQRLVVFSLDFNFMRIMVLFGWARLILRQEFRGYRWNRLDTCYILMAILQMTTFTIVHGSGGFVWRLGTLLESIGVYFMARMLIRDLNDVRTLIYDISIISIPIAFIFLIERSTTRNLFAVFGGVPEFTYVREGKLRCQGAYSHPILAGCFWAALFPLFVSQLLSRGRSKVLAIAGLISSVVIIGCCASSTPVTGVLAALLGFALIPLRASMKRIRWLFLAFVTALHMSMRAPVWHLLARTDFVGGSTGWHRAHLIDKFVAHFNEWVLFGALDISHWQVYGNDVCNQYVLTGMQGGIVTLGVFLLLIALAFGNIGRSWRLVERVREDFLLIWAIGVSLFVHTVNFIGVAYFGQIDILWYMGLAMTTVMHVPRSPGRTIGSRITPMVRPRAVQRANVFPAGYR